MHKLLKVSILLFIYLFLLGACVGTSPPRPWFEGDSDWPSLSYIRIERDGKVGHIEVAITISCSDESALWIYLYATDSKVYPESDAVLYSAKDAYIEKENGERISAGLEFYDRSWPAQGLSPDRCGDSTFHSILQKGSANLNGEKGGVNLRFDTTPPTPGSRWILHLGQIVIGDIQIEVPQKVIILRDREWYLRRLQ